jgi:hypothetical protein
MPLYKRKKTLAAKVEGTPGTAEALTNAEGAFNAYDIMLQPSISFEDREGSGSFNYLTAISQARSATITFKTDVAWDGTATEPSIFTVLMPACGWTETTNVWKPRSEAPGTNVKTLTMGTYVDGVLKTIKGAVGTYVITLTTGGMITIEWTFTGVYVEPTDVAIIAPTYPTESPLRFAAATACSFNSVALKVQKITIDAGNEVALLEDPTDASGFIHAIITNRRPTITANPESILVATQNRHNIWTTSTPYTIQITLDGPSTSTLGITAPKAQIINIQEADRNRIVTDEIEFLCTKNGATQNEELYFTFTPT